MFDFSPKDICVSCAVVMLGSTGAVELLVLVLCSKQELSPCSVMPQQEKQLLCKITATKENTTSSSFQADPAQIVIIQK